MNAFVDAAVILVLLGVAGGVPWGEGMPAAASASAAPAAWWLACCTPALVRSDVSRRRLPNALTLPAVGLVVVGAAVMWGAGGSGRDPALALGVAVATGVAGLLGSMRGGVGVGDVKLAFAAVGSAGLVDLRALAVVAVVTAASGLVAAAVVVWRSARVPAAPPRSPARVPDASPPIPPTALQAGRPAASLSVPYGPCLLAGYWCGMASARVPGLLAFVGPG